MTTREFSDAFQTYYKGYNGDQSMSLDDYEVSLYLTNAQTQILKNYFQPNTNPEQMGFDTSAKRQIDFSTLIKVSEPTEVYNYKDYTKFDDRSKLYRMPEDLFLVLHETADVDADGYKRKVNVIPISYVMYSQLMDKPYKSPSRGTAWRLFQANTGLDLISEIVVKKGAKIDNYKVRYLRRPRPIIVGNLDDLGADSLTIEGYSQVSECELDPILHEEILALAVQLAMQKNDFYKQMMQAQAQQRQKQQRQQE